MKKKINKILKKIFTGAFVFVAFFVFIIQIAYVSKFAVSAELAESVKQAQLLAMLDLDQDGYGNYLIEKPLDYVSLATYVNQGGETRGLIFTQTSDLDFSSYPNGVTPIGISSEYSFNGIYSGQEHCVYNFTITDSYSGDRGFFGYLGASVSIRDLNMMSGEIVANKGFSAGAVAGSASGGGIRRCTNWGVSVSADNDGSSTIGGIVGYACGTVDDSVNIAECGNFTSVLNQSTKIAKAGGIVGYCEYGYIDECMNAGMVQAGKVVIQNYQTKYLTGSAKAGGILGAGLGIDIWNCHNMGNITSYDEPSEFPLWTDILNPPNMGNIMSPNGNQIYDLEPIKASWANAAVYISAWKTVTNESYTASYAGGIAGYIENATDFPSIITDSLNVGEITSNYSSINVKLNINATIKPYNRLYVGDRINLSGSGAVYDGSGIACTFGEVEIDNCYSTSNHASNEGCSFNRNAYVYHPMESTDFGSGNTIVAKPTEQMQKNTSSETYYWTYATVAEILSGLSNPRGGWFEYCIEKFSTVGTTESWETLTEARLVISSTNNSISVSARVTGKGSYWKDGWFGIGGSYKENSTETTQELPIFSASWDGVPSYCQQGIVSTNIEARTLSTTYWFTNTDVSPYPLLRHFFWKENEQIPK